MKLELVKILPEGTCDLQHGEECSKLRRDQLHPVPQSYEALKAQPPPQFMLEAITYAGTSYETLWFGLRGREGRPLSIRRHETCGVELTRYSNNSPNIILQALADHWGCDIVSEYEDETFKPVGSTCAAETH